MCDAPYLDKGQIINWAKSEGLEPPRLYKLGFSHSNCGGQCIRGGVGHWRHLNKVLPDRYLEAEKEEQQIRKIIGADITILTRQRNGEKEKITLEQLRKEIEDDGQMDLFDWGGCGCFTE